MCVCVCVCVCVKVKWSRYRPGVAQRVGKGIALLFHDRGARREWVASSTPWPHFTPGKEPVPILQEARWVPGPVWKGGKSRPHRDSIPDRPARSQSLYQLSYPAHTHTHTHTHTHIIYTGCNRRNGPDFGRVFLMLNYTEKPQNTYIQSWTVWEVMASEVWNFDSCYTLTDYQIRIETGRNMWFL